MPRTGAVQSTSRVARLDEQSLLRDPEFQASLGQIAEKLKMEADKAQDEARSCLEELAVRPQERYLDWVAKLARFMYSRSYDPDLDVNTGQLERLKILSENQPLVFLWSHKSHLDSFVFMRAMYENNFYPQPLSFAGINMNFMGFGSLARRSGAIFVRRSFSDDEIYKLVFRHYIDYLVSKRLPLSWSIEGTRSRTGKLMPPKLGLVNWVIDAYRRSACDNALLVPVSISFDQIPEIDDYSSMQRGLPKRKESLKWFLGYVSGMKSSYGKIHVRFAEPIALNAALTDTAAVSDAMLGDPGKPDRIQTQKLAFEVCSRIEHANPVTGTDLVTLVLLAANNRALTDAEIRRHAGEIATLVEQRSLPTAGNPHLERGQALDITLDLLVKTGLLLRQDRATQAVYSIAPGKQLAAAYYRNTIIHYFLSSALAEMALARAGIRPAEEERDHYQPGERAVEAAVLALRDLLKFEFFFKTKPQFLQDVRDYLDSRYPGWSQRETAAAAIEVAIPLFGHSILRSFIEAYFILAQTLLAKADEQFGQEDRKPLVRNCLEMGEELLLRKQISTETALSEPLLSNAVRLAAHRGLLEGRQQEFQAGRNQFALEMDHALAAVNRLQHLYDEPHEERG